MKIAALLSTSLILVCTGCFQVHITIPADGNVTHEEEHEYERHDDDHYDHDEKESDGDVHEKVIIIDKHKK